MSNEAITNLVTAIVLLLLFIFSFWDVFESIYNFRKRVIRAKSVNSDALIKKIINNEISVYEAIRIINGYQEAPEDLKNAKHRR